MSVSDLGWPSIVTLLLALACLVVTLIYGSDLTSLDFWPLSVAGVASLVVALAHTRRWWLLLTLPLLLSPLAIGAFILTACLMGDCI